MLTLISPPLVIVASAGPAIITLERRLGACGRLLAASMALLTLLLGKATPGWR